MPDDRDNPEKDLASDGLDATAVLSDLEALRLRAEEAEQKRDEYLDLVKRTQADFENYQKRSQRETVLERKYAHASLAIDLLPSLDNLERAITATQQANETGALVQGVSMVLTQVLDIFKRHGITRMDALGKPFDPNLHQAVMQQESAALAPNHVVAVLEQGYMIHDRVLRPARVVVSKAP